MKGKVLVTGGAGYIGSHVLLELLKGGYDAVVVDNLSNSSQLSLKKVEQLTGKKVGFYNVDLLHPADLEKVFKENAFDSVMHFAALKAVGESVEKPLLYYENNISGTLHLLKFVNKYKVRAFIYSSSATVYGNPKTVPIKEDFPIHPTNPYGQTKAMIEQVLRDVYGAFKSPEVVILRYFNPIGADKSGLIGEDPRNIPNNLVPFISQVAVGKLSKLNVYGDDYDTPDGTGVRDYIHVTDLAVGHIKALQKVSTEQGIFTYNLGTGKGYSVLEVVKAFEKASGRKVPFQVVPRRAGDLATVYADPTLANRELNWRAEKTISEMCEDTWRWQSNNPNGYTK